MAIIDRGDRVHMAHMDIHYGFSVNGVAALHTEILKELRAEPFYELYPEKFNNKTNGITFRRWLLDCNPSLAGLIEECIGGGFRKDATELENLLTCKDDPDMLQRLLPIKADNKKAAGRLCCSATQGVDRQPDSPSLTSRSSASMSTSASR